MFGSPIQDPKFDYLGHAAGLKTVSVIVGKYPTLVPVTLGAMVRIFLGLDDAGEPQHTFGQVEEFSEDCKSMTVRYYYTEVEAKAALARWHPRLKKRLQKLFPESSKPNSKMNQEHLLFSSNHRDFSIAIDTVDEIVQAASWYDYEFESHRQIFVAVHHLDVTTGLLHQLQPPESASERVFRIFCCFYCSF